MILFLSYKDDVPFTAIIFPALSFMSFRLFYIMLKLFYDLLSICVIIYFYIVHCYFLLSFVFTQKILVLLLVKNTRYYQMVSYLINFKLIPINKRFNIYITRKKEANTQ